MLPPDFTVHSRYRVIYAVDERPGSIVYRGRDDQTGQRILLAALPLPGNTARDDMELLARQIALVRHEQLLLLTDHFAEDATYYLVCDDPGGRDLERMLRARGDPLPEATTLLQIAGLLGCLETLHSRRPPLYLGDPLPSDLWVGEDGSWRLAPFTLARPIDYAPSPYRAPELAAEQVEPTDASDLYAVGALLYYALTGWAPPAEQQQAGAPLVGPRSLNPAISALAEQAIIRALQLRPANRYQAAREMRLDLEAVQVTGERPLGLEADVLPESPPDVTPPSPVATPLPPPAQPPAVEPASQPLPPGIYPAPALEQTGARAAYSPPSEALAPPGIYPAPTPEQTGARAAYSPPSESLAPPGIYPAPAQPLPAGSYAPPERQRGLSTTCLVAIAIVLTLLAVAVCIALLVLVFSGPLRELFTQHSILPFAGTSAAVTR